MTWKIDFQLKDAEIKKIQTLLAVLPKRIRNGAMRKAGRAAAQIVVRDIRPLVPRSEPKPGNPDYVHLQDGIISKIKTYGNTILVMAGPRTKAKLFHAHLIEYGTRQRATRHTTRYDVVGTKRIKFRVNGKIKYKDKVIKKSAGSFLDQRKLLKGTVRETGIGPAYHYMARGWASAEPKVLAVIKSELTAALATSGVNV